MISISLDEQDDTGGEIEIIELDDYTQKVSDVEDDCCNIISIKLPSLLPRARTSSDNNKEFGFPSKKPRLF